MPTDLDLGHLRLSYPSAGLTLTLSNTARLSSFATHSTLENPPVHQLTSSAWISHGAKMQLTFNITWHPESHLPFDLLRAKLLTAFRHAALWQQLQLSPSLTIEPSTPLNTSLKIVVSLLSLPSPTTKKPLAHRLDLGVPHTHLKPPEGLPHLSLDQVLLRLEIESVSRALKPDLEQDSDHDSMLLDTSSMSDHDSILLETSSTSDLLDITDSFNERDFMLESRSYDFHQSVDVNFASSSTEQASRDFECSSHRDISAIAPESKLVRLDSIINLVDVALRLSITKLPSKSTPGVKIIETSSFKHLEDICPAVWCPDYLQAMASRAVFLPTISHAVSHSLRESARSQSLKAKLDEILHQELLLQQRPQSIQQAITPRLWRMMQRRLHDSSSAKRLIPLQASIDTKPDATYGTNTIPSPPLEADRSIMSSHALHEGLDSEYAYRWEDLFEDAGERVTVPCDCVHDSQQSLMSLELSKLPDTPCDLVMDDCLFTASTTEMSTSLLETMQEREVCFDDPGMLCSW